MKKLREHRVFLLIILYVLLLIFIGWLNNKYYIGYDTEPHVANILALFSTMSFKHPFGFNVLPFAARNFGYGTNIFYPPLVNLLPALIFKFTSLFSNNVFYAIKIYYFIVVAFAGYGMYFFAYKVNKSKTNALLVTILYLFSPYFISDMFVRDAMGETVIFAVLPFIFMGLYKLINNQDMKKFMIPFVLAYVIGMHFHLVLMVYVTFFAGLYLLFNIKKIWNKKSILSLVVASVIILLLSSPMLIRLLTHLIKGSYVVFQKNSVYAFDEIWENSLSFSNFFLNNNPYMWRIYAFLNITSVCLLAFTIIMKKFIKLDQSQNNFFVYSLVTIALLFLLISRYMPWSILPTFLLLIQFPMRLETILCFFLAFNAGYFVFLCNDKKIRDTFTLIIALLALIFGIRYLHFNDYREASYTKIDWNKAVGWDDEYFPTKIIENRDYYDERDSKIHCDNDCELRIFNNDVPSMLFSFKNKIDGEVTIELPRIYYLGYTIKDEKGHRVKYFENENGFIALKLKDSGVYQVSYTGTILERSFVVIRFVFVTSGIIYIVIQKIKKRRSYEKS